MRLLLLPIFFFYLSSITAQHENVYYWSWKSDGIVLGASGLGWGASQFLKGQADKATIEELMNLDRNDVWAIDRGAIGNSSTSAKNISNVFLMGGVALPLISMMDKRVRREAGTVIGMALETYLITDGITNIFKATTKRYRPRAYDFSIPLEKKLTNTARQSFISGHTSAVAAGSFFTAQVLTDMYPTSSWKPVIWVMAASLPALTGYMRYKGGRHFPTDILMGYGVGALTGFLIPKMHRINKDGITLNVIPGAAGLALSVVVPMK